MLTILLRNASDDNELLPACHAWRLSLHTEPRPVRERLGMESVPTPIVIGGAPASSAQERNNVMTGTAPRLCSHFR